MTNFKLTLAYDGTSYYGWQIQPDVPTIQGEVQNALWKILKEKVDVQSAARTDRGVHARAQVANFKTSTFLPPFSLRSALNSLLPPDIRVRKVEKVSDDFHARHSACYKIYRYFLYVRSPLCPWIRNFCWWLSFPLDLEKMKEAASFLIGRHDFSSFQNAGSPSTTTVREIEELKILKKGPIIIIHVRADGFLYKMVRNIVGTLVEVGRGKIKPEYMRELLEVRDRRKAGPTAPAKGLFLWKVGYKCDF
ncbi:tRNA pseudouridine(38-40) synthase TruA [Candidatus Aerophobetes bacterium]|nr:tRNA pseudouridine(38-40) synthase TruA [Candidatus Aerophobetes bacterium]